MILNVGKRAETGRTSRDDDQAVVDVKNVPIKDVDDNHNVEK